VIVYAQIDWILPALTLWRGCGRMVHQELFHSVLRVTSLTGAQNKKWKISEREEDIQSDTRGID
jgi:hypothetical protein